MTPIHAFCALHHADFVTSRRSAIDDLMNSKHNGTQRSYLQYLDKLRNACSTTTPLPF
jgi:hypothetical protein